ncbi:hypothetical protein HY224_02700 [Candidatus Uhrbacteria bacterium]|nr:hypothetical protein [Candidatus Uhrbacteria bacterium]
MKIKGVQYYEYLAYDTKGGLVNRCLKKGGERTWGYRVLFTGLATIGYEPYVVVSDGGTGIYSTLRHFKVSRHQRCHIHLLRDLRVGLRVPGRRIRGVIRKYYILRYARLLLASMTKEQFEIRLKHFNRAIQIMWPPLGDVEI